MQRKLAYALLFFLGMSVFSCNKDDEFDLTKYGFFAFDLTYEFDELLLDDLILQVIPIDEETGEELEPIDEFFVSDLPESYQLPIGSYIIRITASDVLEELLGVEINFDSEVIEISEFDLYIIFIILEEQAIVVEEEENGIDPIEFEAAFGGTGSDVGRDVVEKTGGGGYVAIGYNTSSNGDVTGNQGGRDMWMVSMDENGAIEWEISIGGSNDDRGWGIINANDGGYIAVGATRSTNGDITSNNGGWDVLVAKASSDGVLEWVETYGGSSTDWAYDIVSNGSGYYISSRARSSNGDLTVNRGSYDVWVLSISNNGGINWERSIGGSGSDNGYSIDITSDGGCLVAGGSTSNNFDFTGNHGGWEYCVAKLADNGLVEWTRLYGGSSTDIGYDIDVTPEGNFLMTGRARSSNGDLSSNNGNYDYWIFKADEDGDILWENSLGGSGQDYSWGVIQSDDGNVWASGHSTSTNGDITDPKGSWDYWIVQLSGSTGDLAFQKSYGGSSNDLPYRIMQTTDKGFVINGYSASSNGDVSFNNGSNDYWVLKIDEDGQLNP